MYSTAIVGCGNIAGLLDSKEDEKILTHAHAFHANPKSLLKAYCDRDEGQLRAFGLLWGEGAHAYRSLDEMIEAQPYDIVSVCTPTASHAPIIRRLLEKNAAKLLLCEKPFVATLEELSTLRDAIKSSGTKILINFMRRFDPSIRECARRLRSGFYGKALGFSGFFTKGLYHNGSHMLELLEHLLGPLERFEALEYREDEGDFTGTFHLRTSTCGGTLQNSDGRDFALFELDILCEQGRVRIVESGHEILCYEVRPSKRYRGYRALEPVETLPDTMKQNMLHSVEYAVSLLEGGAQEYSELLEEHLRISEKMLHVKEALQHGHTKLEWNP